MKQSKKLFILEKPNKPLSATDFKYDDCVLEKVSSYKYLGVILDENLNYNECTKTLSDSGGRALGGIIGKFKSLKNVGFKTFETLYNAGVKPVIEYGSGVWGHVAGNYLNKIQNRAMRFYLGVHKHSPNHALTGDMGWMPPKLSRCICRIRLWNRIVAMENDRLTRKIFDWDYNICKRNWAKDMKLLFEELDTTSVILHKEVCCIENVIPKLREKMIHDWKLEIVKKPKLRTFVRFKDTVETEQYVKCLSSRYARSLFTQFRHGILPLKIETGRFKNLPIEDRICELCQLRNVEDECHFLCVCPLYAQLRHSLFIKGSEVHQTFFELSKEDQLVILMSNCWKDVSNFVVSAWQIRQSVLYK